jgi:hypothetical protein
MLPRLTIFVLVVGLLIGVLVIQRRNLVLGQELGRLEQEIRKASRDTALVKASLDREAAPRALEQKMAAWRIAMAPPSETQIRRLRDPAEGDAAPRPRILAQAESPRARVRAP